MDEKLTPAEMQELLRATAEYWRTTMGMDLPAEQAVGQPGKLTKLATSIKNMGNKLRTNVADQWYALRNAPKKRKFQKWCRENNIFGLDVVGSKRVDYDALQRDLQGVIAEVDATNLAAADEKGNG